LEFAAFRQPEAGDLKQSSESFPFGARALDVGRLRWVLLGLVAALGVAIGLVFLIAIRSAHDSTVETTSRQAAAFARTLEEHAARSLGAADAALVKLAETLEGRGPFAQADRIATMRDRRDLVPGAISVAWIGAGGNLVLDSETRGMASGDFSAQPYFAAHRARADLGLYVSPPAYDRARNLWTIGLSRRLEGADGAFAGVVVLMLDAGFFNAYYASLDVGSGAAISLSRADGLLLARHPFDPAALGRLPADPQPPPELRERTHRIVSPLDGAAELQAWRRVQGLPLAVSVAYAEAKNLAPLRESVRVQILAAAAGGVLVLALALLLWFQLGRLRRLDAERRADAERLAQSRRQLRTVVDSVPAIINAKDASGRYTLMNAYQAAIFGVEPRAAIGKRLADFVDPAFAAAVEMRERDLIARGVEIRDEEESFPDAQGRLRHFLTSKVPVFDAAGGVAQFVSVATDVTRVREMERVARAAETRLRAALESIPEGFAIFDESDRLVVANRPYAEMFAGLEDPAAIQGMSFEDIVRLSVARGEPIEPGFDANAWIAERVRRHRDGGAGPRMLKIAGGRTIAVSERQVPGVGLVGIRTDVTRLVETEAALRQARDAAEAANRAKSQFLANMSHELRTPLNAIIGFAEVIEQEMFGKAGNRRYVEYAADIAASGRHLVDLIGDVLDMSKIEAGRYELEEEVIDLRATLDSALTIARGQAGQVGVRLDLRADAPARAAARADGRALRQVLLNLLSNAIKFTAKGGRVEIALRADSDGIEFAVADTGIGIAPEDLPHVTQPFRQAHGVGRHYGGTGLGLAISRRLVELHGGKLEIESASGKGTVARVRLAAERLIREAA
jgi:PAS domain S-box-containing protein